MEQPQDTLAPFALLRQAVLSDPQARLLARQALWPSRTAESVTWRPAVHRMQRVLAWRTARLVEGITLPSSVPLGSELWLKSRLAASVAAFDWGGIARELCADVECEWVNRAAAEHNRRSRALQGGIA